MDSREIDVELIVGAELCEDDIFEWMEENDVYYARDGAERSDDSENSDTESSPKRQRMRPNSLGPVNFASFCKAVSRTHKSLHIAHETNGCVSPSMFTIYVAFNRVPQDLAKFQKADFDMQTWRTFWNHVRLQAAPRPVVMAIGSLR